MSEGTDAGLQITRFSDYLVAERGLSANTVSTYAVQVRSFLSFLASLGKTAAQADTADVTAWLARRRADDFLKTRNSRDTDLSVPTILREKRSAGQKD